MKSTKVFTCSIHWDFQGRYASLEEITSMGDEVIKVYDKCSNGKLKLEMDYKIIESKQVSFTKLLKDIKNDHKGYKYYIIVHNLPSEGDRSGSKHCFIKSTLVRTCAHELGHCIGLSHAGAYDKNGKYDEYGDKTSFMGKYASRNLNVAQLAWMGWLKDVQKITENGEYSLKVPITFTVKDNRENEEDKIYFINYSSKKLRVYLQRRGGSSLLNENMIKELIHYEIIDNLKIKITFK